MPPRGPGACAGSGRGCGGTRPCGARPRPVARHLVVMDRARGGDVERAPAGAREAPAEVGLVRVDEEVRVEVSDLDGGLAADQHRARLHPVDLAGPLPAALHREPPVQEERRRPARSAALESAMRTERARRPRPAAALRPPPRPASACSGVQQGAHGARLQLGVLVQEQAVLARAPPAAVACRSPPCPRAARARSAASSAPQRAHRLGRSVGRGVVQDQHLALDSARARCARSRPGRRADPPGRWC